MELNLIEKRKADNYSGDSITYKLNKLQINDQIALIKKILKLKDLKLLKVKIEYIDEDNKNQIDSFYSKKPNDDIYIKYKNISLCKIKGYFDNTKISFSLDFNDDYIRVKADYTNNFNEQNIKKIVHNL